MATGEIEVLGKELEILNTASTPPFQMDEYTAVGEEVRLHYRYMDLRRHEMQQRLILRSKITSAVRSFLDGEGFLDIETPILTRATPEGARDYLVPSRTHPGQFFALPQSPQLFKQLLMVSGFDRYYQIAKCFRDEDLRADRQPEFTQLDIEMSFVTPEDIYEVVESVVAGMLQEIGVEVERPFRRMPYAEAIDRFGNVEDPPAAVAVVTVGPPFGVSVQVWYFIAGAGLLVAAPAVAEPMTDEATLDEVHLGLKLFDYGAEDEVLVRVEEQPGGEAHAGVRFPSRRGPAVPVAQPRSAGRPRTCCRASSANAAASRASPFQPVSSRDRTGVGFR